MSTKIEASIVQATHREHADGLVVARHGPLELRVVGVVLRGRQIGPKAKREAEGTHDLATIAKLETLDLSKDLLLVLRVKSEVGEGEGEGVGG